MSFNINMLDESHQIKFKSYLTSLVEDATDTLISDIAEQVDAELSDYHGSTASGPEVTDSAAHSAMMDHYSDLNALVTQAVTIIINGGKL